MSDCPNGDIRDLLPDLLHDRLGAEERAAVEAHLRECERCRRELALLRGMRATMRHVPPVDVARVAAAIPSYRVRARHLPSRSWGGWRIAAAVALLAAGGTSVIVARRGARATSDRAPVVSVEQDAASGGSPAARELALTGGSIGELDDRELSALISDIGSLNGLTPVDVDNAVPVSPLAPTLPSGMND